MSNPDGSNVRSDEQVVQWQVADDQLTRYADHALPGTVRTRDDEQGAPELTADADRDGDVGRIEAGVL